MPSCSGISIEVATGLGCEAEATGLLPGLPAGLLAVTVTLRGLETAAGTGLVAEAFAGGALGGNRRAGSEAGRCRPATGRGSRL